MYNKLISVIMSVYNSEKYLSEAIESILNQTYKNYEFIIFDDGSTDNSRQILSNYSSRDSRIKLVFNDENQGLTKNLITGINMAKGTYIARMDADDISLENRFYNQIKFLENNPSISILGTSYISFGDSIRENIIPQPQTHEEIKCYLLLFFTMMHPSTMFRAQSLFENELNYNADFRYSQDFDLWVRSSRVLKMANLDIPLIKIREHNGKVSRKKNSHQTELSNSIRIRQLDELEVDYTKKELDAFNKAASYQWTVDLETLMSYDNILNKIIIQNQKKRIYNQKLLEEKCALFFRNYCLMNLSMGSKSGKYYWNSSMRIYDNITFLNKIKLRLLSTPIYIQLKKILLNVNVS